MIEKSNKIIFATFMTILSASALWFGCSYKYNDQHDYARENASYLDAVDNTAYVALVSDKRVTSIIEGTDASAKAAIQTQLDKLKGLRSNVDGVTYAILLESVLANTDISASNVTKTLATVSIMLGAMSAHDQATALAGSARDTAEADAARDAMTAYTNDRSAGNLEAMISGYYNAISGSRSDLVSSSPVAFSMLFTVSPQAYQGDDSIDATTKALSYINGNKVGDSSIETQRSGVSLMALVISQTTNILSAASAANKDETFQQAMVLQTSRAINSAGAGMSQVATVISTRLITSMIEAGRDQNAIAETTNTLASTLARRSDIAAQARASAAAQSDESLRNRMYGVVARLNQLISFVNTESEATSVSDSTTELAKSIASADGNATTIADAVSTRNTSLSSRVTSTSGSEGSGGSGGSGNGNCDSATAVANLAQGDAWQGGLYGWCQGFLDTSSATDTREYYVVVPSDCTDSDTPTCSGSGPDTVQKNWADAKTRCDNLVYGGKSDWVLPTTSAASSIRYNNNENNDVLQMGQLLTPPTKYWTGVENAGTDAFVSVGTSSMTSYAKTTNTIYVRCVRILSFADLP